MGEKEISRSELIVRSIEECAARASKCIDMATSVEDRIIGVAPSDNIVEEDAEVPRSFVGQASYKLDCLNTRLTKLGSILERINQF